MSSKLYVLMFAVLAAILLLALPACAAEPTGPLGDLIGLLSAAGAGPAYVADRTDGSSSLGLHLSVKPVKTGWWKDHFTAGITAKTVPPIKIGVGPGICANTSPVDIEAGCAWTFHEALPDLFYAALVYRR